MRGMLACSRGVRGSALRYRVRVTPRPLTQCCVQLTYYSERTVSALSGSRAANSAMRGVSGRPKSPVSAGEVLLACSQVRARVRVRVGVRARAKIGVSWG